MAAVAVPKHRLRVLTTSELKCARACLRQHLYRYIMLRRPRKKSEALTFGTLWHIALEAWWRSTMLAMASDIGLRLAAGFAALEAAVSKAGDTVSPFAIVVLEELLTAYTVRWGDESLTAVAVERTFAMRLMSANGEASSTMALGGKIDVVVKGADSKLHVMEHKTTASDIEAGSLYWDRVRSLDTQVGIYLRGARELGYAVEDCIYDVVRKPTIKPLKATPEEQRKYTKATKTEPSRLYANQRELDETPEEYRLRVRADIAERPDWYFARGTVVRLEKEEADLTRDLWEAGHLLEHVIARDWAPHNPDACSSYGGCDFLAVCTGQASIHDDMLFRTAETAHEELVETEEVAQ